MFKALACTIAAVNAVNIEAACGASCAAAPKKTFTAPLQTLAQISETQESIEAEGYAILAQTSVQKEAKCKTEATKATKQCKAISTVAVKKAGKDKSAITSATKAGAECEATVQAAYKKCVKDSGSSAMTISLALFSITAATLAF